MFNRVHSQITFFALTAVLSLGIVQAVFAAEAFDPANARLRLNALESALNVENVTADSIQNAQQRAAEIRNAALRCVRDGESLTSQLNNDLALLGDGTAQDPAEVIEQRTTYEVEIGLVEARVGACRLNILHTQQILDETAALQAELSARRLTQQGINAPSAVAAVLKNPRQVISAFTRTFAGDGQLGRISGPRWTLIGTGIILIAGLGWLARKHSLAWCDKQRGRAGRPTVLVTCVRRLSEHAAIIATGATATIAMLLYSDPPRGDIFLFRLALCVLLYGLGRAAINWIGGSFSPGSELLAKPAHAQVVRIRLHALLLSLLLGWLVLGSGWLVDVPGETGIAVRALLTVYLVAALWWVLRLGRPVPTLRGRIGPLRFALAVAAVTAIGAELAGYRNLANHLLSGSLATMGSGLILWTSIWAMRQSIAGVVSGTSTLSYRIRSWMGMRQEERSAELGWLHAVVITALWVAFGWFLIWVWDPTGNAINWLQERSLQGIEIGGKRFIPKNVLVGVAAFGIIIAFTAWLKARLHRRWLRDMGMDRHAREALVTVSGYAGFAFAVLTGLTLAGVSFAGMALIFGALSVGIGFGLQNIVNNFVSGLILLFERPIKPGDFISLGEVEGIVKEVRTRATEIETLDRQNVLVPNSELVSNQVNNWVLRDTHGRLVLKIGVAYGSDTKRVCELLDEIAREHPEVVTSGRTPEPRVLFMNFGDSALEFELRVWIRHIEKRFGVVSDLNLAIDAAFRENNIVVPFPQRDLHLHPDSAQLLNKNSAATKQTDDDSG